MRDYDDARIGDVPNEADDTEGAEEEWRRLREHDLSRGWGWLAEHGVDVATCFMALRRRSCFVPEVNVTIVLHLHSKRWGHSDAYALEWNSDGWLFNGPHPGSVQVSPSGESGSRGRKDVMASMRNDAIYPSVVVPDALDMLWRDIKDGAVTAEQAQNAATRLADWINHTMERHPGGYWDDKF